MKKLSFLLPFLLILVFVSTTAAVCDQTPAARPKTALQQSAEDLSLSYDLAAKKQLLVNNQEKHAFEMARQEAELQLKVQRTAELSSAEVERLAAEQRVIREELRRRTPPPPPPTRSAIESSEPEAEAPPPRWARAEAEERFPPIQVYQLYQYQPREERYGHERQRPAASSGRRRFLQNTAAWSAIGAGTGATAGAIHSGRRGAISGTWKGAAAGAAIGFLTEALRR